VRRLLRVADWPRLARATGHFLARRWRTLLFALVCLIGPLWGFGVLADDLRDGDPFEFDEPFLRTAQMLRSDTLDWWMLVASEVGYLGGLVPLNVTLLVVLLALKKVRKAVFFALAVGGSALINIGVKLLFARERPSLWESIAPEHSHSFPSGHAMGSMTLAAAAVMLVWNTRWRWPVLLSAGPFAVWVGASRVYLGVHYPSDILAGWVAALAWTAVVYLSVRPHRHTAQLPDADPGSPEAKPAPEELAPPPDAS
jgi:membrane-associated phospholipid phosphatase